MLWRRRNQRKIMQFLYFFRAEIQDVRVSESHALVAHLVPGLVALRHFERLVATRQVLELVLARAKIDLRP